MQGGSLTGGDSAMFYEGSYSEESGRFVANVTTGRHTNDPGFRNVFGRDRVLVDISGTVTGDTINGRGQSPGVPLLVVLTKLAGAGFKLGSSTLSGPDKLSG